MDITVASHTELRRSPDGTVVLVVRTSLPVCGADAGRAETDAGKGEEPARKADLPQKSGTRYKKDPPQKTDARCQPDSQQTPAEAKGKSDPSRKKSRRAAREPLSAAEGVPRAGKGNAEHKKSRKRREKKKAASPKRAPERICAFYADLESAFFGTVERRLLPGTLALYEGDPDPRRRFTFRPRTAEFSALPERQGERWLVRCSVLFRAGSRPIDRQEWTDSFDARTGRLCPPPRPPRRPRSARKGGGADRAIPDAGTGPLARLRRLFSPRSGSQPAPTEQTRVQPQDPGRTDKGGVRRQ